MWFNGKAVNNPPNTTRKNWNVVLSKNIGSYSNEPGFSFNSQSFKNRNANPIGVIELDKDCTCVFSKRQFFDEIGIIDENGVYTGVAGGFLNFSLDHPIHGEFYRNYKNERIVAFTDRATRPKILNLDNPPNIIDEEPLAMFPSYVEPDYNMTEVEAGILKSGAYYITARYKDKDGNKTAWFKTSKPFFITNSTRGETFDNYEGCDANTSTNKAIRVVFEKADLRFPLIEVAIIQKIDGVITSKLVTELTVSTTTETTITGNEITTPIDIREILQENAVFDTINALGQADNILYAGGVKITNIEGIQKYINNVRVTPVRKKKEQGNFSGSDKVKEGFLELTFKSNEVYALYFNLVLTNGTRSQAFPLVNRDAANILINPETGGGSLFMSERTTLQDVLNAGIVAGYDMNYIREDLAIDATAKYFHTRDTSYNPSATSEFGFWENEDELYPDTEDFDVWDSTGQIGTLRNKKVRHFKMPSIRKIKEIFYPTDKTYGVEFLDVIGVQIDLNSLYLPADVSSKVMGFEISYAERTLQNSSVLGQDLTMLECTSSGTSTFRSAGGNWNTLDLQNGLSQQIVRNKLRIHNFDILRYKPSTVPSFIKCNLKITKATELFDINPASPTYVANKFVAVAVTDLGNAKHFNQSSGDNNVGISILSDEIRKTNLFKYIPNHVVDGSQDNRFLEEFGYMEINEAQGKQLSIGNRNFFYAATDINNNTRHFEQIDGINILFGPVEEMYLMDICVHYKNMYTGFYNQKLVSTGFLYRFDEDNSDKELYGGDCFTTFQSFVEYGVRHQDDYNPVDSQLGIKAYKRFVSENFSNTDLRHRVLTDDYTYYYPSDRVGNAYVQIGFNYYRDLEPNGYLYNKDYSSINNILKVFPANPFEDFATDFFNRIYASQPQTSEDSSSLWKTFKSDNYYEMPKNRGKIVALTGYDGDLIICQEYASYETVGSPAMETSEGETFLGAGNIFRVPPRELVTDKNGYAGCQHKYATNLNKYGFVFIDVEQGKVFSKKTREAVKELSRENSLALHDFFRDYTKTVTDNPFNDSGISCAFDEKFERLLISKKKYVLNEFGEQLVSGELGENVYLRRVGNRWFYVNEPEGIGQIVFMGDERFWISQSWTVSYSYDFNCWVSFHEYYPDFIYNTRNQLLSFKDTKHYKHNHLTKKCIYYDENPRDTFITPTFVTPYKTNDNALVSALFGNVTMNINLYSDEEVLQIGKCIDELLAYNSYQSTGNVEMVYYDRSKTLLENFGEFNIREAKKTFYFNQLRDCVIDRTIPFIDDYNSIESNIDQNKSFELKRRLIDKFLVVKLLYKNEKISNLQNTIHFDDIAVMTKPIKR